MATTLAIVWAALTGAASLVMWAAQVPPDQAVSNIYHWLKYFGVKNPPDFLRQKITDKRVRSGAFISLLFLFFIGGIIVTNWWQSFEATSPAPPLLTNAYMDWDGENHLLLVAKAAHEGSNLVVYLDNAQLGGYIGTHGLSGGYVVDTRLEIDKLDHFSKNSEIRITIGTIITDPSGNRAMQWGRSTYDNRKIGLIGPSYAGRVIIDHDNVEDKYPFILLGQEKNLPFIIGPNTFVFFDKWISGGY